MSNHSTNHNEHPEDQASNLGIAGGMAKAFIDSPLSPILLIASLAIGILGLFLTPRQEDPQISVPMIDIFVGYPGASAEQTARQVADPLERIMSEIPGVDHVYSASQRGRAMVTVQFFVGEKMGPSLVKLYDKLQSHMDLVPPGATQPLVKPKAIDDVPSVAITLWSEEVDDAILRKLGTDILQQVKSVPNTGPGFVIGGHEEQVRIELDLPKLASYGISPLQIMQAVNSANSEMPVGDYELGNSNYKVYTGSFLRSAEDVSKIVIGVNQGGVVYMADVANIVPGPAETSRLVHHYTGQAYEGSRPAYGVPAVTVAFSKIEFSNGVDVSKDILKKVDSLKGYLIPDNVNVTITRNYGQTAEEKVNELLVKLVVATGAVTLLVLLFLGIRPAIVTLIVIPIVILITVFGAWLMGFTIDRVSLFALIFAIGILVDDAIVVVENIYRRWLMAGKTSISVAVDAVREVGNPTIVATFTVIAALLPMGFVRDMMGPYMMPIPALGSVAILYSLFAAFAFTPWLTYKLRPTLKKLHQSEEAEQRFQERVGKLYSGIIYKLMRSRVLAWATLIGIILIWFAFVSLFYFKLVTVKMMPYDNKPEFNVVINMPAGTALPVTAQVTQQLADTILSEVPEVVDMQTYVGTVSPYNFNGMVRHYYLRQEPWQADIQIKLLHKNERDRPSHDIASATRDLLTPIAKELGARITVAEMPPGPPVLQTMVAEIYGPDADTRRQFAHDMTRIFEEAESIGDVDNMMEAPHYITRFKVNIDKAMQNGITVETINQSLALTMGGFVASAIKDNHSSDPVEIVIQAPHHSRALTSNLSNLPIMTPDGRMVPLFELGEFVQELNDPVVYHKDLRPVEFVVGEAVGEYAAPIYAIFEVNDMLEDYVSPDGIKVEPSWWAAPETDTVSGFRWEGEWRVTFITFRDMGMAFVAAMLLIYILVVWEFGNFKIPLIIISPIPLTMIGIMLGHWLVGAEFTATSMIGFIALAGIIVRNSILLVDFAQDAVAKGMEKREALALAGQARLRPIVITAFALMGGSMVILTDPIFQGMAVSLFFGVFIATLLTLIVIPMGCDSWGTGMEHPVGPQSPDPDPEDDGPTPGSPAKKLTLEEKLALKKAGKYQAADSAADHTAASPASPPAAPAKKLTLEEKLALKKAGKYAPAAPTTSAQTDATTTAAPAAKKLTLEEKLALKKQGKYQKASSSVDQPEPATKTAADGPADAPKESLTPPPNSLAAQSPPSPAPTRPSTSTPAKSSQSTKKSTAPKRTQPSPASAASSAKRTEAPAPAQPKTKTSARSGRPTAATQTARQPAKKAPKASPGKAAQKPARATSTSKRASPKPAAPGKSPARSTAPTTSGSKRVAQTSARTTQKPKPASQPAVKKSTSTSANKPSAGKAPKTAARGKRRGIRLKPS